jgi:hypothetical protein
VRIDASNIAVSWHAQERYRERRSALTPIEAQAKIRELVGRAKVGPVTVKGNGRVGRRAQVGEFTFILDVDCTTVITCYHRRQTGQAKRQGRKRAGRS